MKAYKIIFLTLEADIHELKSASNLKRLRSSAKSTIPKLIKTIAHKQHWHCRKEWPHNGSSQQ